MSKAKRNWHCPYCSQDSSRHWNLKIHIKRWHNGIGEPIDEEEAKEFKNRTSNQFFSCNWPYSLNESPLGTAKGKAKEPDIIEVFYQIVKEQKEKLRKIKEIKSFFYELSSLSSSQLPVITTGLSQTPIIEPIIPSPVTTTMPLQPIPTALASSSQQQEQKEESINLGTALVVNLFISSTIAVQDFHRNERGKAEDSIIPREPSLPPPVKTTTSDNNNNNNTDSKKGEEIIIPREPSLAPYMMTSTSHDNNKNNNNIKNRGEEADPTTESTNKEQEEEQQQLEENSHNKEKYPSFRVNFLIDNENDDAEKWLKNKDIHDDINVMYKVITGPLLVARGYYFEVKRKAVEMWKENNKKKESIIRRIREGKSILLKKVWTI
jgi:hypothetical protein